MGGNSRLSQSACVYVLCFSVRSHSLLPEGLSILQHRNPLDSLSLSLPPRGRLWCLDVNTTNHHNQQQCINHRRRVRKRRKKIPTEDGGGGRAVAAATAEEILTIETRIENLLHLITTIDQKSNNMSLESKRQERAKVYRKIESLRAKLPPPPVNPVKKDINSLNDDVLLDIFSPYFALHEQVWFHSLFF